jgi:arginyl-tRNA synthetase
MKLKLQNALLSALAKAQAKGDLPQGETPPFVIERPKKNSHGDLATNLAMQLARPLKMNPRQIAQTLLDHLGDADGLIEKAEIAGPGFINFFFQATAWLAVLPAIMEKGGDFGRSGWGSGRKVNVEFVSANPTGPLHVGHGRGAVWGDTLARLLGFTGWEVDTEYYINDAGNQINTLGRSVLVRARQLNGSDEVFPEKHYMGAYIKDMAAEYLKTPEGAGLLDLPEEEAILQCGAWAGERILNGIKDDLKAFRIEQDLFYSEKAMVKRGAVEDCFDELKRLGHLYEKEGALWFRSTDFGDDKDRVVRRSNGETTYFASDIAYHLDKFRRGFVWCINVWGADHHGYVPRMKAAIEALDHERDELELVLVQLVNLLRGGEPVAMSTRAGEFVTLREVVDEVGPDSARFLFLTRRSEQSLDFDLEVAKQKSMDNPVFYVQYAHTRVCSIMRKAREQGVSLPDPAQAELIRLSLEEELAMVRAMNEFGEMVENAARNLEPHRITYYLKDLAGRFHSYYNAHKVLKEDAGLSAARLVLCQAVGQVIKNGLNLLGVNAPEAM